MSSIYAIEPASSFSPSRPETVRPVIDDAGHGRIGSTDIIGTMPTERAFGAENRHLCGGNWLDTQKFATFYHFQRWRCAT